MMLMNGPLADRLRPTQLEEFVGQNHLLKKGKPLRAMIDSGTVSSMILWGPPGCGKTTLAKLVAKSVDASFVELSAVTNTVSDIRKVTKDASEQLTMFQKKTIVFIDEIHRFNKAQQDALLPGVERGIITLIGATTENPGFEVNAPLISRAHVYILEQLTEEDLSSILDRALEMYPGHSIDQKARSFLISATNGDARSMLNAFELAASIAPKIKLTHVEDAVQRKSLYYDKKGDNHYDTISAFIKSMRGSNPDATLHYLARMIEAGEDAVFIARRMVIFASEDIGNAQPTALVLATSCMQAVHMVGMPEAQLILAQTATYLASAKKSIASTVGLGEAKRDIRDNPVGPIPLHLRNAPNKVMKQAGYGKDHIRYPWLEEKKSGTKVDQEYLPKNLKGRTYYRKDW